MTRIDHFNEPDGPRATRVVPAASAVVTDEDGACCWRSAPTTISGRSLAAR